MAGWCRAVGWNCMNSTSATATPARSAMARPSPVASAGIGGHREHLAGAAGGQHRVRRPGPRPAVRRCSGRPRPGTVRPPPAGPGRTTPRGRRRPMPGWRRPAPARPRRRWPRPPAWTTRAVEWPPSRASARAPPGWRSKTAPMAMSSWTRAGPSSTRTRTASASHRPAPAARVSARCRSVESSSPPSTAATPPWAQRVADWDSSALVSTPTRRPGHRRGAPPGRRAAPPGARPPTDRPRRCPAPGRRAAPGPGAGRAHCRRAGGRGCRSAGPGRPGRRRAAGGAPVGRTVDRLEVAGVDQGGVVEGHEGLGGHHRGHGRLDRVPVGSPRPGGRARRPGHGQDRRRRPARPGDEPDVAARQGQPVGLADGGAADDRRRGATGRGRPAARRRAAGSPSRRSTSGTDRRPDSSLTTTVATPSKWPGRDAPSHRVGQAPARTPWSPAARATPGTSRRPTVRTPASRRRPRRRRGRRPGCAGSSSGRRRRRTGSGSRRW